MRGFESLRATTQARQQIHEQLINAARAAAIAVAQEIGEDIKFEGEEFPHPYAVVSKNHGHVLVRLDAERLPSTDYPDQDEWSLHDCQVFAQDVQDGLLERFATRLDRIVTDHDKLCVALAHGSQEDGTKPQTVVRGDILPSALQCMDCRGFIPPEEVRKLGRCLRCPRCGHDALVVVPFSP